MDNVVERLEDLNIWGYDIEVFEFDWFVTFMTTDETKVVQIHNDTAKLRKFLDNQDNLILGAFNNKHYDDGILIAIYYGADNATIKRMNDFIIVKRRNWWDFDFVNFKKKVFTSFDLRDDLPINLSLKAIEANMYLDIEESQVDFNIDRPLTEAEIESTFKYNLADVKAWNVLYKERYDYIHSKLVVGSIKGLKAHEVIGLTNAKLTAKFLEAKKVIRDDEEDYTPPESLRLGKYGIALDFFNDPVGHTIAGLKKRLETETRKVSIRSINRQIKELEESRDRYMCKLETALAGVDHTLAWGGLHGAQLKVYETSDGEYIILMADVTSYYPSLMIIYNYISRNIESLESFKDVYDRRVEAKLNRLKEIADALKLILNTTYGAMKNKYNELYDPRNASAVCITGQLLLTDLIDKLEDGLEYFNLIQSNTDGVGFKVRRSEVDKVHDIVAEWENRTLMTMEYTVINVIAQKDVNNYVMKSGETYIIKDGEKILTGEDIGKIKTKGGYVSLYGGGSFENNSLVVVHDAIVQYLMNGVPVRETIEAETDVHKFQIVAKIGASYTGAVHYIGDDEFPVQKVNRVYATSNKKYGTIKKLKKVNGEYRREKIAGLPDHLKVDNQTMFTLDDIDREFYIELAESRIIDYVGEIKELNDKGSDSNMSETAYLYHPESDSYLTMPLVDYEESTDMDTALCILMDKDEWFREQEKSNQKIENTGGIDHMSKETKTMHIYEKLNAMRTDWLRENVKKTGKNSFAKYMYFTLEDIEPVLINLCNKYNLTTITRFTDELATLTLIDNDAVTFAESAPFPYNMNMSLVEFSSPMVTATMKGMNEIQQVGSVETYQRRYLYMALLNIVEVDAFEEMTGAEISEEVDPKNPDKKRTTAKPATKKNNRPATDAERQEAKDEVINAEGDMTEAQEKALKKGLSKLREVDEDSEDFIKKVVKSMKKGLTKAQADKTLKAIGKKLKEAK